MSVKLGERKNRTPISAYSSDTLVGMLIGANTPNKVKQKIYNHLRKNRIEVSL